jgi:hypothetical protein
MFASRARSLAVKTLSSLRRASTRLSICMPLLCPDIAILSFRSARSVSPDRNRPGSDCSASVGGNKTELSAHQRGKMAVRLRLRPVTVSGVASATPASGRYGPVPKNFSTAPVDRRLRGLVSSFRTATSDLRHGLISPRPGFRLLLGAAADHLARITTAAVRGGM